MECRRGCGACCIAISISSPIPGMPEGKPSGVRCVNLLENMDCGIFGKPERPVICSSFKADLELICGKTAEEAFSKINYLEERTS